MPNDFFTEYAERSDDELLLLASDRDSLTNEAAAALDAELSRRNLTQFGTPRDGSSWVDLFWALVAMSLISIAYLALPSRYHLKADWQEAAVKVMFASVFITVASTFWWRKIAFWISLLISSAIHLILVHAWLRRAGELSRSQGKLAVLLGFVLYGCVWLLRRNFYGEEVRDNS